MCWIQVTMSLEFEIQIHGFNLAIYGVKKNEKLKL